MIGVVDSVRNGGANITQSLVILAIAVNVTTRGTIVEVVAQGAKERDQNKMVMVVSATVMVELKDVAVVTLVLEDVVVVTVQLEDDLGDAASDMSDGSRASRLFVLHTEAQA